ncbi:Tetratricopeptide-like helical [Moorella glycerini]|uniref:Photosystem I assembly protein Ycf3 n=1 Tax=Neomoorella stamsii TaxID=1266720 RepID=A0A9X7P4M3_9FIRM|nr:MULTISPECIES: tetratricopeptide repeat protein [Moorella]PRR68742.1 photosystem I assembly protein Ycf3 [Moorella stamsii]CEP68388.1 Tetratricopeptide-like helical [Moorella glycerini]
MVAGRGYQLNTILQRIASLKKSGDFQAALAEVQAALERWPDEPALLASLASLYLRLGQEQEAGYLADRILQLQPRDPRALAIKGQVATHQKDYPAALACWQAAFDLEPSPYLATRLAQAYIYTGQLEKAVAFCRQQLALDPEQLELWKKLGLALEKMGDTAAAAQAYREVTVRNPNDTFAQARYVKLSATGQDGNSVLSEVNAFLRVGRRAQNPHLHGVKGNELYQQGRYAEAAVAYHQALELAPGDPFFLAQLGFCLYRLRQDEEALNLLQQALEKRPADVHVRQTLMNIYRRLGRQEEGASFFRAVASAHSEARHLWGLAKKLEREGKKD